MANTSTSLDLPAMLSALENARSGGELTATAADNIRKWLTEPRYADYAPLVAEHIQEKRWQKLDDVFWTVIPFGTGGRRGRMYPIGSNAINDRTIGESAQGLADYVKEHQQGPFSCAIAYDTRHRSPEFARLCAEIMVAAGYRVYFLDDIRSTPELSFLVRYKDCSCGIMVTASHNPPSDNAVKVYWNTGGQVLPPHDSRIIDRVMNVDEIRRSDFDQALAGWQDRTLQGGGRRGFPRRVAFTAVPRPPRYQDYLLPAAWRRPDGSLPAFEADGFTNVELFAPHAKPDGDFPNVPHHVANPENVEVFDAIIERAKESGAQLILATDPDCDRLGCAAPLTSDTAGKWATFTGNQIGALLADYILEQRQTAGTLSSDHYVVETLVTTQMIRRIADSYGVKTYGDLQVGFKWIAGVMDEVGPEKFVFGTEESHGYLVGQHVHDKDGAVASMMMAELAALCKANGKSLHEKLDALYWQHGYHSERLVTQQMEGSEGMVKMKKLMERFRTDPPSSLAGIPVAVVRDYGHGTKTRPGEKSEPLKGPAGDLVMFDLAEDGNYVAARPSGTEPKVKFYMFTYVPAEHLADLDLAKNQMSKRLDQMAADLESFASKV